MHKIFLAHAVLIAVLLTTATVLKLQIRMENVTVLLLWCLSIGFCY